MNDTKPINHEEALQYARMHEHDSNLARCYLELAAIKSQPVPVEPEILKAWRGFDKESIHPMHSQIMQYIASLTSALQLAQEERDTWHGEAKFQRDKCWGYIQRAEKAESTVKECQKIAFDWGQGVTDAETAIRALHKLFPIDSARAG